MWTALGTLLGGALMGGGSLVSGLIGAHSSDAAAQRAYDAQMETNALNYQMFKENQAWTERMANTAHQREVTDLREAGLNPILSATGGSGAQTPTIATPVATSPGSNIADKSAIYTAMTNSLLNSLSTAADVADKVTKLQANLENANLLKEKTNREKFESKLAEARTEKTHAEVKYETGRQNPYQILYNLMPGPNTAASTMSPMLPLLKDAFQMIRGQINVYQMQKKLMIQQERKKRDAWDLEGQPSSNTAKPPPIKRVIPTETGYRFEY